MYNPSNFANVDPSFVRSQSQNMNNLSDEEIKRRIEMTRSFMPNMPNLSPEMLRMASQ